MKIITNFSLLISLVIILFIVTNTDARPIKRSQLSVYELNFKNQNIKSKNKFSLKKTKLDKIKLKNLKKIKDKKKK